MQINWGQVVTHIIGFIIAVLVLKRYAWGPILRLLEERREKIRGEFDSIAVQKKDAAAVRADLDGKLRGIEATARTRIQEGVAEGQKIGAEIKEQARRDAREQLDRTKDEVERERDKARVALQRDMVEMVLKATEGLIKERLDDETHRRLIGDFIADLDRLQVEGRGAQ